MASKAKATNPKRTEPTAPPAQGGSYDKDGNLLHRTKEAGPEGPEVVKPTDEE